MEVSSDGVNFFRFPAVCNYSETQMGKFGCAHQSCQYHNFAGKYEAFYGTPFDLDDVEDSPLLDKNRVTHVRLIDVVGNINPEYATYDSKGHVVNDPWPTPFESCGFDLDAVGVIHDLAHSDVTENEAERVSVYPNPAKDRLTVKAENLQSIEIYNVMGQQVMVSTEPTINLSALTEGIYFVRVVCEVGMVTKRIVKQ